MQASSIFLNQGQDNKMIVGSRNISFNLARNLLQSRTILAASHNRTSNGKLLQPTNFNNNVDVRKSSSENNKDLGAKPLKFPVFPLDETMDKFFRSVAAFQHGRELEITINEIEKFKHCHGKKLQKLLEATAEDCENWLADRWLKTAYLQYREPVTINSSPCMTLPKREINTDTEWFEYTSRAIYCLLKYKQMIEEKKIPVIKMGKYVLDNSQFSKIFGTCRIPGKHEDTMVYCPLSLHIVVVYCRFFFRLQVYTKSGKIFTPDAIYQQLLMIKDAIKEEKAAPVDVGVLTHLNRDSWYELYTLIKHQGQNEYNMDDIQKSLFTVSMDKPVTYDPTKITVDELVASQLIHGGGILHNTSNRWMDKTIQLIINRNGMGGFCYEHSPAEGQPVACIADFIANHVTDDSIIDDCLSDEDKCEMEQKQFEIIKFKITPEIEEGINSARRTVQKLVSNLDVKVLHYKNYGKGLLKKHQITPDSFIQMAIQYAFYMIHKVPGIAYESAHLRMYIRGRTETIRSCSVESMEFVKAMVSDATKEKKLELMKRAIQGHREYTSMALQGRGVDRHLLGLKLMAVENCLPIPEFYTQTSFTESSRFRLSTSQVASTNHSFMAYGPLVDNGYGCCYNPREEDMFFGITCRCDNSETTAKCLHDAIETALDNMKLLIDSCGPPPPKSKL